MRKILALIALLLPGLAAAQVPQFPQTLPANTVIGRLGIGPGPTQAIPFATLGLAPGAQAANTVMAGPASGAAALTGFRALVGADLPFPGASSLGGIQSKTCSASNWFNNLTTGGVLGCSQPNFNNLAGNIAVSQMNSGTLASSTTYWRGDGTWATPAGGGNVTGPASAISGNIATFNGTSGTIVQDGGKLGYVNALSAANVSGSAQSTTGTVSATSTALTVASALDFKNGQGIRINHAGTASALIAPTGLTVTATGTAGSTTYGYDVMAFTATGGYGPAAGAGTAAGNATLSATNYNAVSWAAVSGAVGYAVYGNVGAGPFSLIAFVAGTTFNDMGATAFARQTVPDWLPALPQGSAAANWLVTTVSSGGGTTSITLGATATTTATTQGVYHDDTVALQAALTAAIAASQPLNLSSGIYRISSAITGTGPLQIYGNGPTVGVAAGSIVLTSPTQHGLNLSGNYIVLHDFSFQGGGGTSSGQVTGGFMNLNGSGAVWIERISTQYASSAISAPTGAGPFWIGNNLLSGYNSLINIFSIGDSYISNNALSPISIPGSTNASGIFLTGNPGGAKIANNKINAGGYGYATGISLAVSVTDGDLLITGNSIEQCNVTCILVDRTSTPSFANFVITGNQLVSSGRGIQFPSASLWANTIAVTGNVITALVTGIEFVAVTDLMIGNNVLNGSGTGISIGASTVHCMISPNVFATSLAAQIADASAACTYAAITTTKPTYP